MTKTFFHRFIILLLTVLISLGVLICTSARILSRSIFQSEQEQLRPLEQMLSAEFYNASEIVKSLEIYEDVRPFYLQHFPSKATSLIRTLNSHFTNNNIVDEIFLHFFCDEYFYSTKTSYSMRSFMNLFNLSDENGQNGAWLLQKMHEAQSTDDTFYLYGVSTRKSASQSDDSRSILYVYPYEVDGIVVGSVLFQISESKLNAWVGNNEMQNTYIFNHSRMFLNAERPINSIAEKLSDNWITAQMQHAVEGHSNALVQKGYHVFYGAIADTGLYYIRFAVRPPSLILLNALQIFYLCFIIFVLICSRIFFLYGMKEIKKRKDMYMRSREFLSKEIERLQRDIKEAQKNSFLQKLLNGDFPEETALFSQASSLSLTLTADYHFVLIGGEEFYAENSIKALSPSFGQLRYLYSVHIDDMNIWIAGIDQFLPHKLLCEICNFKHVSVGKMFENCSQIHQSYEEAKNHWAITMHFQDYVHQLDQIVERSLEPYERICVQLESGELDNFPMSVQLLMDQWKQAALPQNVQYPMWQKLLLLTDSALHKMYPEYKSIPLDAKEVIFIEDSEQLLELINQRLSAFTRLHKEKRRFQAPALTLEAVLEFIDQSYNSENFSLQLLADHFEISLSYLSLYFKENYGETLLNYYTGLRMEKAKKLLDTTSLPLREIVSAVGYSNVSSFIRRFKQLYGVTPRSYRRMSADKNSE